MYTGLMLARYREYLTLSLLFLLPLHAFAVTVLTKILEGGGESPLAMIAIWKEILLLLILVVAVIEIGRRIVVSGKWEVVSAVDALDICILIALVYSVLIHPWRSDTAVTSYIYGFRYDFVPLIAFLILRRVQWSAYFLRSAPKVLIAVGTLVAAYGILTLILPEKWFAFLGYSALHSLYIPDGPIAAFQYISESGIRRIQSTFSGPNQLGLWLLLPLSLLIGKKKIGEVISDKWSVISAVFILVAIALSFSRAAWIGSAIIIFFLWTRRKNPALMVKKIEKGEQVPALHSFSDGGSTRVSMLVVGIVMFAAVLVYAFPDAIIRPLSSSAHITRPLAALQMIAERPLGYGLGSAGPASNRTSDACVELPEGGDATWAEPFPNLCVFVGGVKVQPIDRECACPVLPENWYLQWGVEMGLLGLLVSLLIPFFVYRKLTMNNGQWTKLVLAAFIAVSVAALFLHAFEDSAVSYTLWILLSATLPLWKVQTAPSSSSTSADSTRT